MVAVNDRASIRLSGFALALLLCFLLPGCSYGDGDVTRLAGSDAASALAKAWVNDQGAYGRQLDASGDISLGDKGIHYAASENVLYGRVWINMAPLDDNPSERLPVYQRMLAALNDPKIGGMFDQADGYFVLNTESQGFYLVRAFPVASTTPAAFLAGMKRLERVGEKWTTAWFLDVAMIMHGKEPAPARKVLLDD